MVEAPVMHASKWTWKSIPIMLCSMSPRVQGKQSQEQRSERHHGCRGAEWRSEVFHTPALPQQPEQVRTRTQTLSVCLSGLQWVNYFLLNGKLQDAAGADGGAAAADAEVGSSAERRASQLGHEEATVLRGAGADPEHEGMFLSMTQPLLGVSAQLCKNIYDVPQSSRQTTEVVMVVNDWGQWGSLVLVKKKNV